MKKRYISGAGLLAYMLVSKRGQDELEKVLSPTISRPFREFEYEYGVTALSAWHWTVGLCCFYLLSVLLLKLYMKDKPAWDLYRFRLFHNAFLSFASLVMVLGLMKEIFTLTWNYGPEVMLCDESRHQQNESNLYFWYYIFFLSKFYEFIDTYILIARKKPISFLHCFHHFITAFLCWVCLQSGMAVQWIVITLNGMIHVAMYYYFMVQTMGGDVWWKKHLTTCQIVQFCLDICATTSWGVYYWGSGKDCSGDVTTFFFGHGILSSFLLLFINFYVQTYRANRRAAAAAKKE